jgi:hypothetical protein
MNNHSEQNNNQFEEKKTRNTLITIAQSSILKKIINDWIAKKRISDENTINDILTICEVETSHIENNKTRTKIHFDPDYSNKQTEQTEREISNIREKIQWLRKNNIITDKNLSVRELLNLLQKIIEESKRFLDEKNHSK